MASSRTLKTRTYQRFPRRFWPGAKKNPDDNDNFARFNSRNKKESILNRSELTPDVRFTKNLWVIAGRP